MDAFYLPKVGLAETASGPGWLVWVSLCGVLSSGCIGPAPKQVLIQPGGIPVSDGASQGRAPSLTVTTFNVWGLPAISVPCGFTQSGLPIGLQIAGPHWREDLVLQLAYAYEQATAWHKRGCVLG